MNFQFCPNCGVKVDLTKIQLNEQKKQLENQSRTPTESLEKLRFECESCQHVRYQNIAATASMILLCGGEILFSQRGREPGKDLLDFPGGFVDAHESLEDAFIREMDEELGWTPEQFQYAFSFPNIYNYQLVQYHTCDAFYFVQVDEKPELEAKDDVAALIWVPIDDIDDSQMAFESVRLAIKELKYALQLSE